MICQGAAAMLRRVACAIALIPVGIVLPGMLALAVVCGGCNSAANQSASSDSARQPATKFMVGHALIGEGNTLASLDLIIGSRSGPVGDGFAQAMVSQREGHPSVFAVLGPDVATKPPTVITAKVTIKEMKQAVKFFGSAQTAVGQAIADSVGESAIDADDCDDLVVICNVFIHPNADDDQAVFDNNYQATKLALKRALQNEPTVDDVRNYRQKTAP
jgi:5,6,7,8-tetrahydromethanopterin hydro-lyase